MMKCTHDHIFDEYDIVYHYNFGEEFAACPTCGAEGMYRVERCECCGEYVDENELTDGICDECFNEYCNNAKDEIIRNIKRELHLVRC